MTLFQSTPAPWPYDAHLSVRRPLTHRTIAFLSQGTTLHPGTLIITGTPPGIGDGRNPKVWLKDGDDVRCWVGGGIGTLVNTMEYEGKAKAKL